MKWALTFMPGIYEPVCPNRPGLGFRATESGAVIAIQRADHWMGNLAGVSLAIHEPDGGPGTGRSGAECLNMTGEQKANCAILLPCEAVPGVVQGFGRY